MKKLVLALLAPLLPAFCLAANNIKMVTYFPVPYASYSNLGVAGTCDVGLLNTCSLDSGPSLKVSKKGSAHALNSGAITVNSGTLSLDSSATEGKVSGISLTAGSTLGNIGSGSLEFKHNLTVNSMPSTIQSAEATNEAIMKSLTLFGQTFPGCDAANNKISWRNLTLNGENGVYLVCGEGEKAPEEEKYKFTPKIEDIQAAGYCKSYGTIRDERGNSSSIGGPRDTMGYYKFARSITQTSEMKNETCRCSPGSMPIQRQGVLQIYNTQFTGEWSLSECPSGADADLCNSNCSPDSPTCAFRCAKNIQVSGCGPQLQTKECYYDYSGGCCTTLACFGRTDSCVDVTEQIGKACAEGFYVDYEPKIGSAQMLSCVRQL